MFRAVLFAAVAACLSAAPAAASPERVASIMEAADQKNWVQVRQLGREGAVRDLALWRILSAGEGGWADYRDFVARSGDWPNLSRIRAEGERAMPAGLPLAEIDAFLGGEGPATGMGALRRSEALRAAGRAAEADAQIVSAWRDLSMTAEETNEFRARHAALIRPHHRERAENLSWRGLTGEAQAIAPLAGRDYARLIEARALLRRRANGVDAAIAAVPGGLKADPGLTFERFLWRMRKGRYGDAEVLLREQSTSVAALGRPEEWANRRRSLARIAFRQGRIDTAYQLASRHFLTEGSDYADLEWLSGWLALRRMGDPQLALHHFTRFATAVGTPISFGRGYYWLGRAHEALGQRAQAEAAWREAARWQTSFYGQLAAEKVGAAPDPVLIAEADGDIGRTRFAGRAVLEAARLLSDAGDRRRAHWFLVHLADIAESHDDFAGAAAFAMDLNRPDAAIRIAKKAASAGHVLNGHYYPLTPLSEFNKGVEPALAMAVARQESELNPEAVSHAGARGLMQLMPGTAKKVAKWVGEDYSHSRLTADWRYNATLGQTYLARRLDQFGGSVALAAAAYNAGAHRAEQWIASYGDPRNPAIDYVDWIETIPFRETRNYVQRVLEGLQVYRSRIAGRHVPFRIERDARGR